MLRCFSILLFAAVLVAGCAQENSIPTAVDTATDDPHSFAKAGSKDADSRANYTFYGFWDSESSLATAIHDDGSGRYVSGECGVHGKIFTGESGSGDAVFDPDKNKDRTCSLRKLVIGGQSTGAFMNIMNILDRPDRQEYRGKVVFDQVNGAFGCDRLFFAGAHIVEVQARSADTPGKWEVRSNETTGHEAECRVWQKGSYMNVGNVPTPFRVLVEEVLVR